MRAMFVCSGNSANFGVAPFIRSQGDSLAGEGVSVSYFVIKGKGLTGYLKNIPKLYRQYRSEGYDLIHAHFGLSALVAILAIPIRPVVVSFMGSDLHGRRDLRGRVMGKNTLARVTAFMVERWADHLIVKSPGLASFFSKRRKLTVLPNGVDLKRFKAMDKLEARQLLGLGQSRVVLFLGNVESGIKNFQLCQEAVGRLEEKVQLVTPYPCRHDEVVRYLSAADLLVVTSWHEGSPNVVKEAMACGCPVVSTDVGDVRWLLEGLEGCRVVGFDVEEVSGAIRECLRFGGRTSGRDRIIELGLGSEEIAAKLASIYHGLTERGLKAEGCGP